MTDAEWLAPSDTPEFPCPSAHGAPVTEVQSSEQSLDFMLSEISSPAVIDDSHGADKNVIEFDLGSPELDIGIPALADPEIKEPKKNSDGLDVDSLGFDLHELEFSITAGTASHGASGNDFNTKLDLARAYVEMGDNDMARSLLQEVQLLGSEHQQQEAASLLQRLPA